MPSIKRGTSLTLADAVLHGETRGSFWTSQISLETSSYMVTRERQSWFSVKPLTWWLSPWLLSLRFSGPGCWHGEGGLCCWNEVSLLSKGRFRSAKQCPLTVTKSESQQIVYASLGKSYFKSITWWRFPYRLGPCEWQASQHFPGHKRHFFSPGWWMWPMQWKSISCRGLQFLIPTRSWHVWADRVAHSVNLEPDFHLEVVALTMTFLPRCYWLKFYAVAWPPFLPFSYLYFIFSLSLSLPL